MIHVVINFLTDLIFRHQRSSLGDFHLIALNITDLMVCFLSAVNLFCLNEYTQGRLTYDSEYAQNWHIYCGFPLTILALFSCFITTILSVSRTLVLFKPLYVVNRLTVYLAYGFFLIFSTILYAIRCALYVHQSSSTFFKFKAVTEFSLIMAMVITVGVSSITAVRILKKPDNVLSAPARHSKENSRNATTMILILSVIFVITNGISCIFWVYLSTAIYPGIVERTEEDTENLASLFGMFQSIFLIALNSWANPVVYVVKNSALNNYVKTKLRRCKVFLLSGLESVKCA